LDCLLVRAGALGDILLLRGAVASLRGAGATVRLLAPARTGQVLVGPGEVDVVVPLDGAGMADLLGGNAPPDELAAALRADAVLALTRSHDLVAALRPHAGRLVQRDPEPPPGIHAADWAAEAARALGGRRTERIPPMSFTAEERAAVSSLGASLPPRFLAVHPGSGSTTKNWPSERFARLVCARTGRGERWLLVAGPADGEAVAPLRDVPGAVLASGLAPRVLAALLSRAGLYVGNDSGVSHLAAAAGAPTLALFGPTDPASWAPRGRRALTLRSSDHSMVGLELEAVATAAAELARGHATGA
jgi:lipopolysaccharide heptosyltransferase III